MIDWDQIFTGIQLCMVIQLSLLGIVNLVSNEQRNKILGVYCILIAQIPLILNFSEYLRSEPFWIITVWAWKGFFYGPLLYSFIVSLNKEKLRSKFFFQHLTLPFILYLISVFNAGWVEPGTDLRFILNQVKYISYWSITLTYFVLGLKSFTTYLGNTLDDRSRSRYLTFYVATNTHLTLVVPIDMVLALSKLTEWGWIQPIYKYVALPFFYYGQEPYCLLLMGFLLFFGATELSWFKKHFTKKSIHIDALESTNVKKTLKDLEAVIYDQKIHHRPNLTLSDLSNSIGIYQKDIRQCLTKSNFSTLSDYINYLRLKEVKKNLMNEEFSNYDFLSIAKESGFTSKATFYRVFKKYTGETPSDFISKTRLHDADTSK